MWRMLTSRAEDLKVELAEHDATSAHWIASYTFTQTGRQVVNDVHADIRVENGLIVDHVDRFSSGPGRVRRSARPVCCSAGRRCCATRSAARPARAWTSSCDVHNRIDRDRTARARATDTRWWPSSTA